MILALQNKKRVGAKPNEKAICPMCGGNVIAKCGSIISWHWAHYTNDCDTWSESESQWHLEWKKKFPEQWQEIVIGNHRADVKTPKCVIEFQNSSIGVEDILEREIHYGNMVWVINASVFKKNIYFRKRENYISFRWKWPRKSWFKATMPMYFDFDGNLFQVKKVHEKVPCGGWGNWIDNKSFMARVGAI